MKNQKLQHWIEFLVEIEKKSEIFWTLNSFLDQCVICHLTDFRQKTDVSFAGSRKGSKFVSKLLESRSRARGAWATFKKIKINFDEKQSDKRGHSFLVTFRL